jgi:hypothetical protein
MKIGALICREVHGISFNGKVRNSVTQLEETGNGQSSSLDETTAEVPCSVPAVCGKNANGISAVIFRRVRGMQNAVAHAGAVAGV